MELYKDASSDVVEKFIELWYISLFQYYVLMPHLIFKLI